MTKHDFKSLIDRVKQESIEIPIQKVAPIRKHKKEEVQFNFHIDKDLLKTLKLIAIDENRSLKEIIHDSINLYLKKRT